MRRTVRWLIFKAVEMLSIQPLTGVNRETNSPQPAHQGQNPTSAGIHWCSLVFGFLLRVADDPVNFRREQAKNAFAGARGAGNLSGFFGRQFASANPTYYSHRHSMCSFDVNFLHPYTIDILNTMIVHGKR